MSKPDYPARGAAWDRIRRLADAQRANAADLYDAVNEAQAAGVTWREIGKALGIPHETAFRQVKAGSPVVVVKATQRSQKGGACA